MTRTVLEWAPFQVQQDTTEEQLLATSARLQTDFLDRQQGFVRRTLIRTQPGSYVDIVWWESRELAHAAMERAMKSEACASYFSVMQMSEQPDANHGVELFEVLGS